MNFKIIISWFLTIIVIPICIVIILLWKFNIIKYKTCAQIISIVPGILGIFLRRIFYKITLKKCGENLNVFWGAVIVYSDVEIGNNCTIEEFCIISHCKIGNDVIFAANVSVMSGAKHHDVNDITTSFYNSKSECRKLSLGNNLWIGTHAVIMNDIGSNCAIGAGAV
ncbi:acyltransferase, partial [Candidatus Symbiopectobacterium sp. NZEC127]